MTQKSILLIVVVLTWLFAGTSCSNDVNPMAKMKPKPRALGKMNEIVIITDDHLWDSGMRDTLDYYFGGAYPITPSPEARFDLRQYSATKINNESLRRELRTYMVMADLSDTESATTQMVKRDLGEERFNRALTDDTFHTSVGKNKWATGQIIIYLFANSKDKLEAEIKNNFNSITSRIYKHDKEQLDALSFAVGENRGLREKIIADYGLDMRIPGDYKLVQEVEEENLIWLKKETKRGNMSLVFTSEEYKNKGQFDKEHIKSLRDTYGKKYVSSDAEGSYMVTNDVDLPILEYPADIDGLFAREYRGIWHLEKDFMGGPFISFAILNKEETQLIFIDGFILSPGEKKRNMLQQMQHIVTSAKAAPAN